VAPSLEQKSDHKLKVPRNKDGMGASPVPGSAPCKANEKMVIAYEMWGGGFTHMKIRVVFSCIMTSYNLVCGTDLSLWVGENVYSIRNYWAFGLCSWSDILETIKHNVSETGSVSVLR
jgi:hypothetical protein